MRRRRRRVNRIELAFAAIVGAVMIGGSLWLDREGPLVTARVAAKQERIVVGFDPSGDWDRYYEVGAAFDLPDGASSQATVRVSEKRYDALGPGDPIEVRYLPQVPVLARTGDRSTASVLGELGWRFAGSPLLVWLAIGVPLLWVAARIGTAPVIAAGAAWAAAAWPLLFTPPSREHPRPAQATAEVTNLTLVDRSPSRIVPTGRWRKQVVRRLDVPYQVVELRVPVDGGRDTVLAVDAVDSGSVSGLAHGSRLPVWFDPAAPREAQLADGTRRFVTVNRYHSLAPVAACAILATLAGLAYGHRTRSRTTPLEGGT